MLDLTQNMAYANSTVVNPAVRNSSLFICALKAQPKDQASFFVSTLWRNVKGDFGLTVTQVQCCYPDRSVTLCVAAFGDGLLKLLPVEAMMPKSNIIDATSRIKPSHTYILNFVREEVFPHTPRLSKKAREEIEMKALLRGVFYNIQVGECEV